MTEAEPVQIPRRYVNTLFPKTCVGVARWMPAGAFLLSACGAGWHRTDLVVPNTKSPRQQVEVWQGDSARRWHAVRVSDDSVSGIPFLRPIDCDSCRIAIARASVDSVRLGDPVGGFWLGVAAFVVVPALVVAWIFRDLGS
ncbi:MAG TPA: hypothetical protein VMC86_04830 [Gemmatimonadales bacterium]|nr:hypothetical protein [Gemmatimonadales bacterium]